MNDLADLDAPALEAPPAPRPRLALTPPRPTLGERAAAGLAYWRDALAYIACATTPIIAYLGNLGFASMVALVGIGSLVLLGRRAKPSIGVGLLFLLLVWALVSMSWSPALPVHPDFHRYKTVESITGLKLPFELALYAAFVMALRRVSDEAAARATLIMAAGLAAVVVLLVIEALNGAALYQWIKAHAHQKTRPDLALRNVARGCYVATLLFWPLALRLRRAHQPAILAVLTGGLIISSAIFKVDAPMLALALSSLVFLAVQRLGRAPIYILIAGAVIYFALAPLVAHLVTGLLHPHELPGQIGKASWAERLDIWRFVSGEIYANPIKGWGLDASRAWPNDIPLHPHDAALQLWLELGVLGPFLAALFWGWLLLRIAAMVEGDRNMAAAAAASASAYLTIGALSFGVWQEWWLALGALAVATCGWVAASRRLDPPRGANFIELQPL